MTREAGTIRERIFQSLIKRYTADQEEALVQIDALLRGDVVPGHYALTEDIDKILGKVASAAEKMAILRRPLYPKILFLSYPRAKNSSEVSAKSIFLLLSLLE